ncbi:diaminobutyrate--2-oxoglutarate transaminase [Pseudonocardia xinjiangensis]
MMTERRNSTGMDVFARRESRVRSYSRKYEIVFEGARGTLVWDAEGREYLDFLAGAGSLNYGHNDPDMAEALIAHIRGGGIAQGLDLFTRPKMEFLEAFEGLVLEPRGMDYRIQFTGPTGTNAVEAALKLARKVTGRRNVISFTNGFHGVSQGALAATGNRDNRMGTTLSLPDVTRMPYDGYHGASIDTAEMLDRMLSDPSSGVDAPAAILLETVQGEGGLNVASRPWLRRIAATAQAHGALLIVDDIQAGVGRTGSFFSFEGTGVTPDLVTLSKSISGFGLPMSLLLIKPEWDIWKPGEHNGTFRGNAHAFVTAKVALEKFWADRSFQEDIERSSALVGQRLERIAKLVPGARVKGRGMMQGIDVRDGDVAAEICRQSARQGLIVESAGPRDEVVKILAPLTTSEQLLNRGLDILEESAASGLHAIAV